MGTSGNQEINLSKLFTMKTKIPLLLLCIVLFQFFSIERIMAQTSGIESGAIYKIRSKANSKLLNVSNSSLDNSANVDIWTDTDSDAERWVVSHLGSSIYTFQNIGTGKYLHITNSTPANMVNVDQYDNTNNNDVRWTIVNNGDGSYTPQAASNAAFSLDVNGSLAADGTNVQLYANNGTPAQRWSFEKVTARTAAPTTATADAIFSAWKSKYYDTRTGNEVIANEGFWGVAEMMEIVVDGYEVTGNAKYRNLFDEMYNLFIAKEGQDWMWNDFNDDITWMVLACVRAGILTNNQTYINKAKEQFDKMYARAIHDNGNWLTWKQGISGTNSCINGPAIVACNYLAQATGDNGYYTKAISLYNWSKNNLFEPGTGKVYDNNDNGTINNWSSTYNQGSYLGASVMLYNYTKDQSYLTIADKIAQYTKVNMYNSGVINNEEGTDLEGFKGILMRYARKYIIDCNRADYISWLQLNARVAFNNRNTENIISTLWSRRTAEATYYKAFSASTAMSLLINCPYSTSIIKNAYNTIESENFNYLKGVIVEPCPDGTSNLGGVQNGFYTAYYNVDFGTIGSATAQFRLSCATQGGTIEIRTGGLTGTLIGTAIVTGTGGWSTYATVTCAVSNVKGLQNIYLVYKGSDYLFNINNFKFTQASNVICATVYKDCNFSGTAVGIKVGKYTLTDMKAIGILNDDISSIKVSAGYKVIGYWDDNFGGTTLALTADDNCLDDNGWNDKISSMEVVATTARNESTSLISNNYEKVTVIYPNPANDMITLTDVPTNSTVTIFDSSGRSLMRSKPQPKSEEVSINVSGLNAGVYFIKVGDKAKKMVKLIKQ